MTEPRASELIIATFHVKHIWVERKGVTTRGRRPAWLDWPSHTVAEMAERVEPTKPKGNRR